MQWSRVKSILVVILVIVDAFLLATLLGGYVVEHKRENDKTEHFISVLQGKSVSTGEEFYLPKMQSLPMLEVDRSKNDEDAFTKGLLGEEMERTEDSDGNTLYSNAMGTLQWGSDGKLTGYFTPDGYQMPSGERDLRVLTAKILERCGISSSIQIEVDLASNCASAAFDTAGAPVFNRFLKFSFGERQVIVGGWWTFQTPYMVQTNNYVNCEAADAILALLKEETSVSKIESAELGYVLTDTTGRRTSIVPCCRILTDRGEFFVDSLKNIVIYR